MVSPSLDSSLEHLRTAPGLRASQPALRKQITSDVEVSGAPPILASLDDEIKSDNISLDLLDSSTPPLLAPPPFHLPAIVPNDPTPK